MASISPKATDKVAYSSGGWKHWVLERIFKIERRVRILNLLGKLRQRVNLHDVSWQLHLEIFGLFCIYFTYLIINLTPVSSPERWHFHSAASCHLPFPFDWSYCICGIESKSPSWLNYADYRRQRHSHLHSHFKIDWLKTTSWWDNWKTSRIETYQLFFSLENVSFSF